MPVPSSRSRSRSGHRKIGCHFHAQKSCTARTTCSSRPSSSVGRPGASRGGEVTRCPWIDADLRVWPSRRQRRGTVGIPGVLRNALRAPATLAPATRERARRDWWPTAACGHQSFTSGVEGDLGRAVYPHSFIRCVGEGKLAASWGRRTALPHPRLQGCIGDGRSYQVPPRSAYFGSSRI